MTPDIKNVVIRRELTRATIVAAGAAVALLLACFVAAAQTHYPYDVPPAGNCDMLLAAGGTVWAGDFRGTYTDVFDHRRLLYVEGCFRTERACRRWVNEVQSFAVEPGLMRCRRVG